MVESENLNLIDRIQEAIETDDSNKDRQSENLQNYYYEACDEERRAIDRVFIALCGWSLRMLIAGNEDPDYNPFI